MHENTTIQLNHYMNEQQCKFLVGSIFEKVIREQVIDFFHAELSSEMQKAMREMIDKTYSEEVHNKLKDKLDEAVKEVSSETINNNYIPAAVFNLLKKNGFSEEVSQYLVNYDPVRYQIVDKVSEKVAKILIDRMTYDSGY